MRLLGVLLAHFALSLFKSGYIPRLDEIGLPDDVFWIAVPTALAAGFANPVAGSPILFPTRLRRARVVMKRATVCGDAGAEVGLSLVLGARSLVGPGVPRAPRIATASAHLRFRLRGLHASVAEGDVSWKSCIHVVPVWMCMPAV
jgi:hypothetical protein